MAKWKAARVPELDHHRPQRQGQGEHQGQGGRIFGVVKGNIEVSEKIAIREKGSLIGDIKTAGISIDDGAYFKGSIDIVRPEPAPRTRPRSSAKPPAVSRDDRKEPAHRFARPGSVWVRVLRPAGS